MLTKRILFLFLLLSIIGACSYQTAYLGYNRLSPEEKELYYRYADRLTLDERAHYLNLKTEGERAEYLQQLLTDKLGEQEPVIAIPEGTVYPLSEPGAPTSKSSKLLEERAISFKSIFPGMSKEALESSWGTPDEISQELDDWGLREKLVYRYKSEREYIYRFVGEKKDVTVYVGNGVVTKWTVE